MTENNREYVPYQDIESGEWVYIRRETWGAMQYWKKLVEPKINPDMKIKGTIRIIGTLSDDFEKGEYLKNMFLNADKKDNHE